jgi:hypothetical protein
MPVAENYRRQAALLIKVAPFIAAEKCFALKGGTAINLFVRCGRGKRREHFCGELRRYG